MNKYQYIYHQKRQTSNWFFLLIGRFSNRRSKNIASNIEKTITVSNILSNAITTQAQLSGGKLFMEKNQTYEL